MGKLNEGYTLRYLALPTLVDVVAGDVLLLFIEFCLEVSLELARMVYELGDVLLHAVKDGFLLFVLGKDLDAVIDLEKKGKNHSIVCGLVLCISGWCCMGWVGLETIN